MVRRLLNGEIKSLPAAAMILAAASLVSRVVGVLRDRILAGEFGAGEKLDIYYAAFRLPDLLFQLLVLGALSAGFIPMFTTLLQQDKKSAWLFVNNVLHIIFISFGIVAVFVFVSAPLLVRTMIAPGFSFEAQHVTVLLTRIMLLSPIFLGISALFTGIAQTFRRFFVPAIAPIFYNVGIMAGALFFAPRFGIVGVAWGVIAGAFLHAIIQWPAVYAVGFRYTFVCVWDEKMRALVRLMVPRILTLGIANIELVVLTAFASSLPKGSLSIFNFANNLQSFPIGIIGASYAVAAFPSFSEAVARNDRDGFIQSFSGVVRQLFFFMIPATVIFIALKAQIVRSILGTGAFDWQATVLTFETVQAFAYGFIAQTIFFVLVRGFWAYADTIRPSIIAVVGAIATLGVAFVGRNIFGVSGLALALSLGVIVETIVLWIVLRRRVGSLDEMRIVFSVLKMIIAAIAMGFVTQYIKYVLASLIGTETFLGITTQGLTAGVAGLFVYCGVLWCLRSSELFAIGEGIRRRIRPHVEQLELFE
ncbi:MAG: murein biosynthesis integral membrane protein MurJ [bacterium]|nr:murein biosynthesis integral membrane protein MurJ [bacterium]